MRTPSPHMRRLEPEEMDAFVRAAVVVFGDHMLPEEVAFVREELEIERAPASFEACEIVATIAAVSMEF